jgi:hypothetical protein
MPSKCHTHLRQKSRSRVMQKGEHKLHNFEQFVSTKSEAFRYNSHSMHVTVLGRNSPSPLTARGFNLLFVY